MNKLNKAQSKRLEKIQDELLDLIDEYFPKIKPMGRNKGRGEAAVLVGMALVRFKKLLAEELSREYVRGYQDGSGSIITKKLVNDFIKRLSKNK